MKRIIISRQNGGYTTALTNYGKLIEILHDSDDSCSITGNIYAGIVKKINAGFIFLDIGLGKQVFLDSRDHRERGLFYGTKLTVKQGDILIVQILRDGYGDKAPAATSCISYAGRFVVLSKSVQGDKDRVAVSRKISNNDEHNRIKALGERLVPAGFSAIMRTCAENQSENEITEDIHTVSQKFDNHETWHHARGPAVLFAEPPIVKTLREIYADDIDEVVVDDAGVYEILKENYSYRLRYHSDDEPIFSAYFIKSQIDKIRDKKVWLKSGAFIIIEKTEACVVVDVNSGKLMAKKGNIALKVNLEAAKEIAYQLRLRNLSGIIIVDFIAMRSPDDTHSLTELLRELTRNDRIPTTVVGMTALGLMELTRKRIRPPY